MREEVARNGEVKGVSGRMYQALVDALNDNLKKDEVAAREAGPRSHCSFYKGEEFRLGIGHKGDMMFYWVFGTDPNQVEACANTLKTLDEIYKMYIRKN